MFLFLIPILTSLLFGGSEARAQDNAYNAPNQLNQPYYTPYGPSNQYNGQQNRGQQYSVSPFQQFQNFEPYGIQPFDPFAPVQSSPPLGGGCAPPPCQPPPPPCANPIEEELKSRVARDMPIVTTPASEPAVPEAPCDKPGSERMPLEMLCSLPPDKGTGDDDIFRYYYNPVVQQCIPFSYSGKGGNANRFVSVKNCYEICHPADPTVKKPRVVSGIKAYLVPNLKSDCSKKSKGEKGAKGQQEDNNQAFDSQKIREQPKEVVIRQIPHPLDPSKTLTIIQNAQYIPSDTLKGGIGGKDNSLPNINQMIDPNVRRLYQYETVPEYIPYQPYGQSYGQPAYGR